MIIKGNNDNKYDNKYLNKVQSIIKGLLGTLNCDL